MSLRVSSIAGASLVAMSTAVAAFAGPVPGMTPMAAPLAAPAASTSSITLFEKPNFQGRSMTFTNRVPSLNAVGFNDLAQSVKITGKQDWVLCESRNFLGRCIRVHEKEKDLKRQKFSSLASSIYQVP